MSLLNRAVLSHLLVAVPPAVALGWMVADINQSALEVESQLVHLSLAGQLRAELLAQVETMGALLGHAERILDLEELPLERRQDLLRALVADGRLPHLALYRPDGQWDTVVRARGQEGQDQRPAPEPLRRMALARGLGVGTVHVDSEELLLLVPWRRGAETLGFLGTTLAPRRLDALAGRLARTHLGEEGRLEVADLSGARLVSAAGEHGPLPGGALAGVALSPGGLAQLEAGLSTRFVDERGEERLAALLSVPALGCVVATSRPVKVALASVERVRARVLLLALLAALLAGLAGLLLARHISAPIQALIAQVGERARRGFAPAEELRAGGELGLLARAFNAALAELERYRRELRQTTQLRLKLSRFVSAGAARDLLATVEMPSGALEPVTVLYADVVRTGPEASTPATEHLVSELGELFGAAHAAMGRHGGQADRYSGDAIIGVFPGTPAGAAGGLAAALELVEDARAVSERWAQAGLALQATVGLALGQARLARSADGEVSVAGELVERAQALQAAAPPGVVRLDSSARAALQRGEPVQGQGEVFEVRPPTT